MEKKSVTISEKSSKCSNPACYHPVITKDAKPIPEKVVEKETPKCCDCRKPKKSRCCDWKSKDKTSFRPPPDKSGLDEKGRYIPEDDRNIEKAKGVTTCICCDGQPPTNTSIQSIPKKPNTEKNVEKEKESTKPIIIAENGVSPCICCDGGKPKKTSKHSCCGRKSKRDASKPCCDEVKKAEEKPPAPMCCDCPKKKKLLCCVRKSKEATERKPSIVKARPGLDKKGQYTNIPDDTGDTTSKKGIAPCVCCDGQTSKNTPKEVEKEKKPTIITEKTSKCSNASCYQPTFPKPEKVIEEETPICCDCRKPKKIEKVKKPVIIPEKPSKCSNTACYHPVITEDTKPKPEKVVEEETPVCCGCGKPKKIEKEKKPVIISQKPSKCSNASCYHPVIIKETKPEKLVEKETPGCCDCQNSKKIEKEKKPVIITEKPSKCSNASCYHPVVIKVPKPEKIVEKDKTPMCCDCRKPKKSRCCDRKSSKAPSVISKSSVCCDSQTPIISENGVAPCVCCDAKKPKKASKPCCGRKKDKTDERKPNKVSKKIKLKKGKDAERNELITPVVSEDDTTSVSNDSRKSKRKSKKGRWCAKNKKRKERTPKDDSEQQEDIDKEQNKKKIKPERVPIFDTGKGQIDRPGKENPPTKNEKQKPEKVRPDRSREGPGRFSKKKPRRRGDKLDEYSQPYDYSQTSNDSLLDRPFLSHYDRAFNRSVKPVCNRNEMLERNRGCFWW